MDETQHRLAILYADVSGSTRLYERFGDDLARADIGICLDLLSRIAAHLKGDVVKTIGDEAMCRFPNPLMAALAAIEMQESLRDAGEGGRFTTGALRIKIGWHFGDVAWRGHELIGDAPVTAQQIIRMARADEILTSGPSIESLPPDIKKRAYPMGNITSEISGSVIPVFGLRWEETEEATQISGADESSVPRRALVLQFGANKMRVDESHPCCHMGRAEENEVCVPGHYASRQHAVIEFRHGNFHIKDGSVNGTVIQFNDGRTVRLHREEDLLTGSGRIGMGATPDEEPAATIAFYCK